jgi:hypothetical protein
MSPSPSGTDPVGSNREGYSLSPGTSNNSNRGFAKPVQYKQTMLHCVALVRTDVSEECIASIIRVMRIGERRNIPDDGILHSHRRGNLKYYKALTGWSL